MNAVISTIAFSIVQWLEANQLPCPVKKYLHISCPGCGFQRSLIELLNGNLKMSLQYHLATIPLLVFLLFAFTQLIYPLKNGNKLIVYGYIFVAAIVVTSYIYKIIQSTLT